MGTCFSMDVGAARFDPSQSHRSIFEQYLRVSPTIAMTFSESHRRRSPEYPFAVAGVLTYPNALRPSLVSRSEHLQQPTLSDPLLQESYDRSRARLTPILKALPEIESIEIGMLHVFLQHTSAGLLITENADPDVLVDLSCAMNALAPEGDHWIHSCEGPDDMPAHVTSVLEGPSVSVPVGNGKLLLGTWQGIFLAEHRRHAGSRRLILSLSGSTRASLAPFTRQEAST